MKSLCQFVTESLNKEIKLYNLSYDINEKSKKANSLDNKNFVKYLYDSCIITQKVEFVYVDEKGKPIEEETKEKHYVVKPAETTIIFGSTWELLKIVKELNNHEELDFALQELAIERNEVKGLIINNYNTNVDNDIKSEEKENIQQSPDIKKMIHLMDIKPNIIKVKFITTNIN